MHSLFNNIIKFPTREYNEKIYMDKNYWRVYEESLKNDFRNVYTNIVISLDEIEYFYENIMNIKYNFYGDTELQVIKLVFSDGILYLNIIEKNEIILMINTFLTTFKYNSKLQIYINCINNCDSHNYHTSLIELCLNNMIENTKLPIIKLNLLIDTFFKKLSISNDVQLHILNNCTSLINKISSILKIDFNKAINLLNKCSSLKQKFINLNKLSNSNEFQDLINLIFDNLIQYVNKSEMYNNDKLFKICNNTFKLLNLLDFKNTQLNLLITTRYDELNKVAPLLINYLCASIYNYIGDFEKVESFIDFQKYNINSISFLLIYKQKFQQRCNHKLNIDFEMTIYERLLSIFVDENKYLKLILNSIQDMKVCNFLNNEIKKCKINIQTPNYQSINFNLNKLNTKITSQLLWTTNKEFYKPNIPSNINIYCTIVENYYKTNYENTNLNLCYDESNIKLVLGECNIKMSINQYLILREIGNNPNISIDNLIENIGLNETLINNIIEILINHKLIKCIDNKYFIFNKNICNENRSLNLIKINPLEITKEEIEENKEYLDELIDCMIVSNLKINPLNRKELINVINKIDNMLDDNIIRRIYRLIELEYIEEKDNILFYIP